MEKALEKVGSMVRKRCDDDSVDRFNYFYTPVMLGIFAVCLAAKQYVGDPLQCWVPAQFKDPWEKYAETYCFIENTYFVGFNESFPRTNPEREDRELHYYQWVPFMLAAQILLFTLPKNIWNTFNLKTGFHLNSLVDKAMIYSKQPKKDSKSKTQTTKLKTTLKQDAREAAKHIHDVLEYNNQQQGMNQENKKKPSQNYVTNLYLFFKLLNLIVCVAQLFLLNHFLAPDHSYLWGLDIVKDLYNGNPWQHSGHFPRVTYCDINIREQGGHMVQHTFQCVLMINMFNEKCYVFIWFWLVLLTIMDIFNLAKWFVHSIHGKGDRKFVISHLTKHDRFKKLKNKYCEDDVDNFQQLWKYCSVLSAHPLFEKFLSSGYNSSTTKEVQNTNSFYLGNNGLNNKSAKPHDAHENGTLKSLNSKPLQQNGFTKRTNSITAPNSIHPTTPVSAPIAQPSLALVPNHMPNSEFKVEMKARAAGLGVPMEQSIDEDQPHQPVTTQYIQNIVATVRQRDDQERDQQDLDHLPKPPTFEPGH
uniref:Innexin n=1 Tax=Ditylenchus dipsaci TaxID=166011 RepID=A0A915E8E4_9BILA